MNPPPLFSFGLVGRASEAGWQRGQQEAALDKQRSWPAIVHIYLKSAWILLKCWEEVVNSAVATAYECIHRTVIEGWVCVLFKTGGPSKCPVYGPSAKKWARWPKEAQNLHMSSVLGFAAEFVFRIQESCEMARVKQRALLIDAFRVGRINAFGVAWAYRFCGA